MAGELLIFGQNTGRRLIAGERLAQGSYGTVWQARDVASSDYSFAIKVPRPIYNKKIGQVLNREAKIQSSFSHPHITPVELYDVFVYTDKRGNTRHTLGIVTPLADSTLFRTIDTNAPLSLQSAISIMDDVGGAYEAVHQSGLVYCDSSPSNILLRNQPDGLLSAEITDFGHVHTPQLEEQNSDIVIGVPMYSAPETFEGICTHASDQFGWAAGVAYPAVTREAPWVQDNLPYDKLFWNYEYISPRSFKEIIGARKMTRLHEAIEEVTERALRENPIDRYASMAVLLDDLRLKLVKAREEQKRSRRYLT
jgi:serine/threonine protein kinase, bacterial